MSYEIPDVWRDEDYFIPPGNGESERADDPDDEREPDHGFYPDWCGDV